MKTISVGLNTHLALPGTTLAYCWLVTRTDGLILGFTNHDQKIEFGGQEYEPFSGFTRSAARTVAGVSVNSQDIDGAFSSASISEADLFAGLWDFATIRSFTVNWADLTQGEIKGQKGKLGQVKSGRIAFTAELRSLTQELQQTIGRLYGILCDADLGDARCTKSLGAFTFTGAITGVTSSRVFADTSRSEATGYFDYGVITWTSGSNNGLSMEVKTYNSSGDVIALVLPMPYDVQIGDTYSIIAGCDKKRATCITKYSNIVNFRGFPFIPGPDQLISGGL